MKSILLLCFAIILTSCSTTQTKQLERPVTIASDKAYAMIQYIYKDEVPGDLTMTFGDSESKTLKVTVRKDFPSEMGVLFEVPPNRRMRLFNITAYFERPWSVDDATDEFATEPGKISHIGIYSFSIKNSMLYITRLDTSKSEEFMNSAAKYYGVSKKLIIPPAQTSSGDQ